VLYFNEFTLDFFTRRSQLLRHLSKCRIRHPPGDEIYRKDNIWWVCQMTVGAICSVRVV
jgi:hypothetical protein